MYSVNEQFDIEVTRGDTALLRIDLSGRDLPDGTEAVFTVKKNLGDEEPVLQKRFDASDEVLSILLHPQETDLEPGVYLWDVRLLIPLQEGGWEICTPMHYASLTVLETVGSFAGSSITSGVEADLPVIPRLIEQIRAALGGLHPVGSLYLSVDEVNPSVYFGGTWERIQDTFLLAAGSTYAAGATGGEAVHRLTENEVPFFSVTTLKDLSPARATIKSASSGSSVAVVTGITPTSGNQSYGGSNPVHNNLPPYLAVYVWKRTA